LNEKLGKDKWRRIDANQAKMDANTKHMQDDITAYQEKADADRKADQENLKKKKIDEITPAPKEMMARMERMMNTN
jgi:galactose-1-phosphate uridylyltransferase